MIKKPNTKEQLVDYLLKYISLGTYDKKFVGNILQLNVAASKSVTTNQAALLDKIILRYHRQLAKAELNSIDMVNLTWTLPPIESSPIYTEAHVSVMDDTTLIIHSPYKKDFVKELKQYDYMNWDRENKLWSTVASEHTLKQVLETVNLHYDKVNYCPIVQQVVDTVKEYESMQYWNPTLSRINGNLYVVAANGPLMEAIKNIPLDTDYHTLARLSRMGIRIEPALISMVHDELGGSDEVLKKLIFAIDPHPKIEMSNQSMVIEHLLDIKADIVILNQWFGTNKSYVMELANLLKANKIEHKILKTKSGLGEVIDSELKAYAMPIKLNIGVFNTHGSLKHIAKNVQLVNSNEIYIEYK